MRLPLSEAPGFESGVLRSLLASEGRFIPTRDVPAWVETRRVNQHCVVTETPLRDLPNWGIQPGTGDLAHTSGKFFRVHGLEGAGDFPAPVRFNQPIISQPEVGILGILAREFDGVLYFLLQAKMEAGNVNLVQLSPTVQATRSNYTQVHGGSRPTFLEFFTDRSMGRVLADQLQSEQGFFFLRKRNRNIIVITDRDVPPHEDYCWLTLGQIKQLLQLDNLVNMDTRTVIAAIPLLSKQDAGRAVRTLDAASTYDEALLASSLERRGLHTSEEIISWLTGIRATIELDLRTVGLAALHGWTSDGTSVRRDDGGYFSVIGVTASATSREVRSWGQPLLKPDAIGTLAFLTQRIQSTLHFLVQARLEPGLWNQVELGPSVQYLPGAVTSEDTRYLDLVTSPDPSAVRHTSIQSEEGGRFYHYQNRNVILELPPGRPIDEPPNYRWMTLGQINRLMMYGNYLNIEARSLVACLSLQAT